MRIKLKKIEALGHDRYKREDIVISIPIRQEPTDLLSNVGEA